MAPRSHLERILDQQPLPEVLASGPSQLVGLNSREASVQGDGLEPDLQNRCSVVEGAPVPPPTHQKAR